MKPSPRGSPGRVAVGEPGVREVVAVETLDDGGPGAAQEPVVLRAFPVRRFRVGQAVDGVDLAGRGPAGEFVDARLGDEQLAGLPVEPFVRLRARRPPPCTPASPTDAMSYSPGSGLSSSYSIPATPSASLAASSAAPARSAPPVDSRMESIALTAFAHPDSLSTRLRVCSASLRVCLSCRSSHCRNGSGNASRTRLSGQDAGLLHSSANCMDGSSLFVLAWPYARGWVARCLPDESRTPGLERAEAHDRLSARVRPVRGTAMPSPGAAAPYRSAFICRHAADVETLPGQRQQRRTVLGERATFLRVLAAVRFRGQFQAPVRQPGVKVLQAPYARPGHEQLAPHHTRPWTPPRPSHDRNTGCPTSNRTRNAPGRPGTGAVGRGSRSPCPLWPMPAALSNTIRSGTPPSHSNRLRNARHVHSAFSPGINYTRPTFEYGKSSTK